MPEVEPAPACVDHLPTIDGTTTGDIDGHNAAEPVIGDELELPDGRYLIVYRRSSSGPDA